MTEQASAAEVTSAEPTTGAEVTPDVAEVTEVDAGDAGETDVEAAIEGLSTEQLETLRELLPKYQHTLNVAGEERTLSFEELEQFANKGFGADDKFREAAEIRKQAEQHSRMVEQLVNQLKNDPRSVLEQYSDPKLVRSFAEDFLGEQLRFEMMSPEEQERDSQLKEYKKLKAEHEEMVKSQENAKAKSLEEEYKEHYDKTIAEALEGSGLPQNANTVKRMAELMYSALDKGIDADPKDLVEIIKQDYQQDLSSVLGGLDEETLYNYLGKDVAAKIRKRDLAKLKTPTKAGATSRNPSRSESKPGTKNLSFAEFSKIARERAGIA